ncbi:MAG: hypothetical protein ACJ8DI_02050 [Ktedonobacteraceae bacterium]
MTTRKRHVPEQVTLVGVSLSPGAGVRAWRRPQRTYCSEACKQAAYRRREQGVAVNLLRQYHSAGGGWHRLSGLLVEIGGKRWKRLFVGGAGWALP